MTLLPEWLMQQKAAHAESSSPAVPRCCPSTLAAALLIPAQQPSPVFQACRVVPAALCRIAARPLYALHCHDVSQALRVLRTLAVLQGATSWLMMYLLQTKGAANAAAAAFTVSGLELGGLLGSTLAGFVSDARVRSATAQGGSAAGTVGRRVQVVMVRVRAVLIVTISAHASLRIWRLRCAAGLLICALKAQV